eukprot:5984371-Prymnesium_polylepis.2
MSAAARMAIHSAGQRPGQQFEPNRNEFSASTSAVHAHPARTVAYSPSRILFPHIRSRTVPCWRRQWPCTHRVQGTWWP